MNANQLKKLRRTRRHIGIRKRIIGDASRPRLAVFRSSKHIYAQLIDDLSGRTLVAASSVDQKIDKGGNVEAAKVVGKAFAEKAVAAGHKEAAFDRGGFRYHGRVKALAEAAREAGLKF